MASLTAITPLAGFAPRIGLYVAQMDDVRRRTKAYVKDLTQEQLAWHPQPNVESIGTLLLHIAAVERSWIGEDIEHRPMGEEWKIGFPIRFGIPQISGKPLAYYFEQLNAIRAETHAALARLTDDDLQQAITPLDSGDSTEQYSIEWILYHLVEHEAHHKGQIAVMKRLLPH